MLLWITMIPRVETIPRDPMEQETKTLTFLEVAKRARVAGHVCSRPALHT